MQCIFVHLICGSVFSLSTGGEGSSSISYYWKTNLIFLFYLSAILKIYIGLDV